MSQHPHTWGMTHMTWSYIVWGIWAVGLFLVIEFAARDLLGWAPWFTLSGTIKALVRDHPWFALVLLFAAELGLIHLLFPHNTWGL